MIVFPGDYSKIALIHWLCKSPHVDVAFSPAHDASGISEETVAQTCAPRSAALMEVVEHV
jgi:hypothetical protein